MSYLMLTLLMQASPILLIIFAVGCGKKKIKTEELKRSPNVPKPALTGNAKAASLPPSTPSLAKKEEEKEEKGELPEKSCKDDEEKSSGKEEKNEEEIKPKQIPRTAKEEEIAKNKVTVNMGDYPTFIDVLIDWDSNKNKKNPSEKKDDKKEGGSKKGEKKGDKDKKDAGKDKKEVKKEDKEAKEEEKKEDDRGKEE